MSNRLWVPESAKGDDKIRHSGDKPQIRLPNITVDTPDNWTRNTECLRAEERQREAERLAEAKKATGNTPRRHHASPEVRKRRKAIKAAKKHNRGRK